MPAYDADMQTRDEVLRLVASLKSCGTTAERQYLKSETFFCKRSLRPSEYIHGFRGLHVPPLGKERLKNEAACLKYVREHTNIPVPTVKCAFEINESFYLITSYVHGTELHELADEVKAPYMEELQGHLEDLHSLRSTIIGGPAGLIIPPLWVLKTMPKKNWILEPCKPSESRAYVFCHNDLSEYNVVLDTASGRIKAILDWEFAGYWPAYCEAPMYRRTGPDAQAGHNAAYVAQTKAFLESYERVKNRRLTS